MCSTGRRRSARRSAAHKNQLSTFAQRAHSSCPRQCVAFDCRGGDNMRGWIASKDTLMTLHPDSLAYPPRGMSRDEAARYIGVGVTKFDEMVSDRRMPRQYNAPLHHET